MASRTPIAAVDKDSDSLILRPVSPSSSTPWIFGTLVTLSGSSALSLKGVLSFFSSRKSDGVVFGAGALICLGACCYCLYRVFNPLTDRQVEPLSSSHNGETCKTHLQMLQEVESRLKELIPTEEENGLETTPSLPLHDSIQNLLSQLETLFPEMTQQIDGLKDDLAREIAQKETPASPDREGDPLNSSGALDRSMGDSEFERNLLGKLEALGKKIDRDRSARSSKASSTVTSPKPRIKVSDGNAERKALAGSGGSTTSQKEEDQNK